MDHLIYNKKCFFLQISHSYFCGFSDPKETIFTRRQMMDLFFACRFPPQDKQRIPVTVRLMMILSKSSNAISGTKMDLPGKVVK